MSSPQTQRDFALYVVEQLREAGYESLWAGGCVRDELLGLAPKDYDVATSARPEQVRELFGRRRTLAIGASFGVISVLGRKPLEPIEVATFRSDGDYVDGRHPTQVVFTSADEDAQRRDFTINGLFHDPVEAKLIDYVGGEKDLRAGLVRAIGDPTARFEEDKLRMLRAVRFATTFDFCIDEATLQAIRKMAGGVLVVSAERIGAELRKVLLHPARARALILLRQTQLLRPLLPDLAELDNSAWSKLKARLSALENPSLPAAFAALLCDVPDPALVSQLGRGLRFTNKEIERASWLVTNLANVEQAPDLPWPQLQRIAIHDGASELHTLAIAALGAEHPGVQEFQATQRLPAEKLNPPPLVSGDDLLAHGLRPGRNFGKLLTAIRDAQLMEDIGNQQQALEFAEQWLKDQV